METAALAHRRLGGQVVRGLLEAVVPLLRTQYVDERVHRRAVTAYLAHLRRRSSLVDHVSFELMRELDIGRALAFDADFQREGFALE